MELKRVPVDLGELEAALTDSNVGTSYFLDTETGEIIMIADFMDRGECEELSDQIDEAPDGRYVRVDPFESRVEYGDMVDFTDSVADKHVRRLLEVALNGRGAFRRFRDLLDDEPKERKRWFQFRNARMRRRVLEWLAENELAPATGS